MQLYHTLLVGAGQLGSRHLQALALSELNISITVVDPFEQSLSLAKKRFEQIDNSKNINAINFYTSLDQVEKNIDLCIIATNADCRLSILKNIVRTLKVKNILFEKVLFQSEGQLDEAEALLLKNNINAWVNCPRRMQPIYHKLKNLLINENYIELEVRGNTWGLACNAIHMIDLWAYLMNNTDYKLDTRSLLPQIFDSKRANFKELGGTLKGTSGDNKILLNCDMNDVPVSIFHSIKTPNFDIKIDEHKGKCEIIYINSQHSEIIDFNIIYQSNLTNAASEKILNCGISDLTSFSDSVSLHRPFLRAVLNFLNRHDNQNYTLCPIT